MAYTPQQWHDDDTSAPYGPINGTRLNYIEAGIEAAAAVADAAGGGGAAIGTATPVVDGSATAGTASTASAVDHVHPTDTSRSALASPTFTGTPAAPTAAADTSTTQLATTAYVVGQGYAKLASPTFTGTVVLPTGTISTGMILDGTILNADISASAAVAVSKLAPGTAAQVLTTTGGTAVWADAGGGGAPSGAAGGDLSGTYPNPTVAKLNGVGAASYALLAGPTFTGSPVLPTGTTGVTQTASDNSTKLATTAYTDTADALKANLASPTFTGSPVLPTGTTGVTQSALNNTTALATTAYADRAANQFNPEFYLNGATANVRETMDRRTCNSATVALAATGVMTSMPIVLYAGDTITNLSFIIGTYTAGANQNQWVALYDTQATPALLSQSADGGTASITQNTIYTKALGTAQTIPTSGVYYAAIMVKTVNAVPTLLGINTSTVATNAKLSSQVALLRSSGAGLTTTAPGTITGASTGAGMGYAVTS